MGETTMAPEGPPPGGLLAAMMQVGLIRQSELAVTTALAWLATRHHVATGLADMAAELHPALRPPGGARWTGEVRADDGTRTDLECAWGDRFEPRIVVEAKLGAALTSEQIWTYVHDQGRRVSPQTERAMVLLVPLHRRGEAQRCLDDALGRPDAPTVQRLVTAVWDYNELFGRLQTASGAGDPDVEQLRQLVAAAESLDVRPLDPSDLAEPGARREADLVKLLNYATKALTPPGVRRGRGGPGPYFVWQRYIEPLPHGPNVSVGLLKSPAPAGVSATVSPVWLRVDRKTPGGAEVMARMARDIASYVSADGHGWVPLVVPTGVGGESVVQSLVDQGQHVMECLSAWEPASEPSPRGVGDPGVDRGGL